MATDKKITDLAVVTPLTGAELVEVVQGGVNKQTTTQGIADLGGGSVSTSERIELIIPGLAGETVDYEVKWGFTVTGWNIYSNTSGSIVIDIWKDSYANFPPTVADTITGSEKPTLSSATKNQDLSLTTWTDLTFTVGEILRFNVDSASTLFKVTLVLIGTRS